MHINAKKWDQQHSNAVEFHEIENGKFIPINRPCDWCGNKVAKGYIHKDCCEKETKLYLEILYD